MGLVAFAGIRELHRRCLMNCLNQTFNLTARYCNSSSRAFTTENVFSFDCTFSESDVTMIIKACRGDAKLGAAFHSCAVSSGFIQYPSVSNSLMSMYCKAGKFDHALTLFHSLDEPDIVNYNTILTGFPNRDAALRFAANMNANGIIFNPVTYITALSFCGDDQGFLLGFQLHCSIVKSGLESRVFVGNALITLYSRWGRIIEAEKVFDKMITKDYVSWNAMLCGYSQERSRGVGTIRTFSEMVKHGVRADHVSLTAGIMACGYERNLKAGRLLHGLSIKRGYGRYSSVCILLMSVYAKCNVNEDVKRVFQDMAERNAIAWTAMISVFPEEALGLFHGMRVDGVYPSEVTFVGLLHAITESNTVNEGQMIHGFCLRTSFVSELHVSSSLISMYAKFKSVGDGVKVFEELHYRDVISWNSLISGYSQNGLYQEAFKAFRSAISEIRPDQYTFRGVLSAIGSADDISLKHGQTWHCHLVKSGLNSDPIVSRALHAMYAKRGRRSESKRVFKGVRRISKKQWMKRKIYQTHQEISAYEPLT